MAEKLPAKLTFEEALAELEDITSKLEGGREPPEESIKLYERGSLLRKFCEDKLKQAEGTWKILKKKKNGKVELETISSESIPEPDELSGSQDSIF